VIDSADGGSVELGVRFRSDVNGFITGLRFYKSAANTGTHIGHLWSSNGDLLASATFTNETATGWQQVAFNTAVAVTAGTSYIASYFAPNGHYSVTFGSFASAGIDNAPLHLSQDTVSAPDGLYSYGPTSTFPNFTYASSNYWVDIVFITNVGGVFGPNVTSVLPGSGATGVNTTTTISATFSKSLAPATVNTGTFKLLDPSNNVIPGSVAYDPNTSTATLTPSTALTFGRSYTAVISGGSGGVTDVSGNPMPVSVSWLFTTQPPPPGTCPCSIWNSGTTPTTLDSGDPSAVEIGVKFRTDVNGFVTAIRFFKSAANTGTHTGHLWARDGTLLASGTFSGETGQGWQQMTFSSPVAITAGTTYIVSYFAPNGHYSLGAAYFGSSGANDGPLHFLQDGVDGGNGVYAYGASSAFPVSTYNASNYWVDLIFSTP
jgi:hypothetical protein